MLSIAAALVGLLATCTESVERTDGGSGGGDTCPVDETYDPAIESTKFVAVIDNPFLPLVPGTTSTFRSGDETIEVTVTTDTKVILGVTCVIVRDTVTVDGELVEDTLDFFAQAVDGTVWYFGENTKSYEDGKLVSTEGSWEAGVAGAKPGIVMQATPTPNGPYRQEYRPCVAEDEAEVISVGQAVTVPFGDFTGCVKTRDFTRLEPNVNEHKLYCSGVGLVLEEDVRTGERTELIAVTQP